MNTPKPWVAVTQQINPNDFYVRVDDSDFYIAYWVVLSTSQDSAHDLVMTVAEELLLGETSILDVSQYQPGDNIHSEAVTQRVQDLIAKLANQEGAQIAAWISEHGGLW